MPAPAEKLINDALQARREGRHEDAKRDLLEAVRKAGAPAELAQALTALGQIERDLHHLDAALHHYEKAAAIYRAEGNDLRLAHTVRHLGDLHRHAGNAALSESCYDEALNIYRSNLQTPPLDLANAIRGLAILKGDTGDTPRSIALWTEARNLYAEVGVNEGLAESDRRLALLSQRSS